MNQWMISLFLVMTGITANAGELRAVIGPNPSEVLPIDLPTCQQEIAGEVTNPKLLKPAVDFGTFKLQWTGHNPLRISYIELVFRDASLTGGTYTCVVSPSELTTMNPAFSSGIPGGNPNAIHIAACGIRCGSVPFNLDSGPTSIQGTATVHGVEYDSQGVGSSVTSQTPITIQKRY